MPYVGDDVHQARKRRWEDDKNEVYRLYAQEKQQPAFYVLNQAAQEGLQAARKMLPLAKRPRTIEDDIHIHGDLPPAHRRRTSQPRALQDQPLSSVGNKGPSVRTGGVLLTPCHICHRKPTKKSDLDSFAECQGCRERTCFVCIRECQQWNADEASSLLLSRSFHMNDADDGRQGPHSSDTDDRMNLRNDNNTNENNEIGGNNSGKGWDAGGHRAMVCSRCCVERGAEGEVVCLGCLSIMELA